MVKEGKGAIQSCGGGGEVKSVRYKMNSRMYCTPWGIHPAFSNNYKWKANFNNCIIRKKERNCREVGGKKARKIMAFLEVKNQH